MKIKTTLFTATLLLAAGRVEAQSADGAIDAVSDVASVDDGGADVSVTPDAAFDAAVDSVDVSATADAPIDVADGAIDGPDASASPDAEVDASTDSHDAAVADGAADGGKVVLTDAGSPPDIRLFVHEDPGCSFGGSPGRSGWMATGAGLLALVVLVKRRAG